MVARFFEQETVGAPLQQHPGIRFGNGNNFFRAGFLGRFEQVSVGRIAFGCFKVVRLPVDLLCVGVAQAPAHDQEAADGFVFCAAFRESCECVADGQVFRHSQFFLVGHPFHLHVQVFEGVVQVFQPVKFEHLVVHHLEVAQVLGGHVLLAGGYHFGLELQDFVAGELLHRQIAAYLYEFAERGPVSFKGGGRHFAGIAFFFQNFLGCGGEGRKLLAVALELLPEDVEAWRYIARYQFIGDQAGLVQFVAEVGVHHYGAFAAQGGAGFHGLRPGVPIFRQYFPGQGDVIGVVIPGVAQVEFLQTEAVYPTPLDDGNAGLSHTKKEYRNWYRLNPAARPDKAALSRKER